MSARFFRSFLLALAWVLSCLAASVVAAPQGKVASVARVALAVGDSSRIGADRQPQALRVGSWLHEGDRIRTGPDAVVMLVFVDEGRISVRPESELWIKQYDVDPKGVNTRIELELVKGTMRQISGNASRMQPERYRLNTPVAAIGVRGTDFLAKIGAGGVETLVQEGKIFVQAKHIEGCAQIDCSGLLGPAQLAGTYLRVSAAGEIEQRAYRASDVEQSFALNLVQGADRRRSQLPAVDIARLKGIASELPAGAQFISDSIFMVVQNPALDRSVMPGPGSESETPSPPTNPGLPPSTSPGGVDLATDSATHLQRQLVWGRFSQANELPNQWVVNYDQASSGRHVTVGELGQYALWREGLPGPLDASLQGLVRFNLTGAQAMLEQGANVSLAAINAATLDINFDRSSFTAGVDLSHQATGAQTLRVSGIVNNEGIFVGVNDKERVAGALSRDGSEAGYLFSKDTAAGRLRGITLWTRGK